MSTHQSQQLQEWLEIFIHTLNELYFYPSQDGARTLFYADQSPNDRKIRIKGLQVALGCDSQKNNIAQTVRFGVKCPYESLLFWHFL